MDTRTPPAKRPLFGTDMAAVEKAKKILDEQLRTAPKIAELARLTGTSLAKLQKDFKTAFGVTIHAYVQTERASRTLERIERSDEPLYIIAQDVGCKKPSRFTEIFKKIYGMTPVEYRRKMNE
jgi:methylphosphotriester-DNA--protein-cysteine methyltransferase